MSKIRSLFKAASLRPRQRPQGEVVGESRLNQFLDAGAQLRVRREPGGRRAAMGAEELGDQVGLLELEAVGVLPAQHGGLRDEVLVEWPVGRPFDVLQEVAEGQLLRRL